MRLATPILEADHPRLPLAPQDQADTQMTVNSELEMCNFAWRIAPAAPAAHLFCVQSQH